MRSLLLLFISVTIFSCSGDDMPANVLSQEKMAEITLEIHMAEARIDNYRPKLQNDSAKKVFAMFRKEILEKHQVSDTAYEQSLTYYFENPDKLSEVYEQVIDSLNLDLQMARDSTINSE